MTEAELAFYDALETNDSAVRGLGAETLRAIARELVRNSLTIDRRLRENVRAQITGAGAREPVAACPPEVEGSMSGAGVILGDVDLRPALRSTLIARNADQPGTVIIEELGVCRGRVRIDIAVLNGSLHGYEIKSDRDSLRRLSVQVDFYGRVLDRATLVVGERHLAEALGLLPAWWGVLRIHQTAHEPRFMTVRRGRKNPRKDPRSLVEFLWLDDALALLEARDAARGVRGKPRRLLWDRICEHFSVDEIAAAVRAQLMARAATQAPARPSKCGEPSRAGATP